MGVNNPSEKDKKKKRLTRWIQNLDSSLNVTKEELMTSDEASSYEVAVLKLSGSFSIPSQNV